MLRKYGTININNQFIYALSIYMLIVPITGILALGGNKIFFQVPKIPFYFMFLLFVLIALKSRELKLHMASLLFIFFLPIAALVGFYEHDFTQITLSHLYTTIMPVLAISFGAQFYNRFDSNPDLSIKLRKLMDIAFVEYLFIFPIYYLLNHFGKIAYWGLGTTGLTMLALYVLNNKRYGKFIMVIILIIVSGKRSILIATLFSSLAVLKPSLQKLKIKNILIGLLLIVSIIAVYTVADKFDMFRRFELTAQYDFSDDTSMYTATGGRFQEAEAVIEYLNNNNYWLQGGGFGAQFSTYDLVGNETKRHYSHFTPLAYVLVYGIIFTLIFYTIIIIELIKVLGCDEQRTSFFGLLFLALFINSFFGASLFSDPLFWVVLGILRAQRTRLQKNKQMLTFRLI